MSFRLHPIYDRLYITSTPERSAHVKGIIGKIKDSRSSWKWWWTAYEADLNDKENWCIVHGDPIYFNPDTKKIIKMKENWTSPNIYKLEDHDDQRQLFINLILTKVQKENT